MPPSTTQPHTVDGLLRVIEARDSELALLKLMVDKLKLQLLRRVRAEFGTSSEQLAAQVTFIEGAALPERKLAPARAEHANAPANAPAINRSLPAHLPREPHVHWPKATAAHHDTPASPAAAPPAVAGCARSARTCPSGWNTCRRTSRSFAMCGPSWPAHAASRSSRPPPRAG